MNLKNRTIFNRDNLDILKGINSNCIDLIYLDPPFNKKKEFTAPIGSSAEGASFKDWFREADVKDDWLKEIQEDYDGLYKFLNNIKELSNITASKNNKHYLYNYCYLSYMAIRLIEMRRILKDTGSIYLHCDPTMSHYIKILMDIIFGENNFRNEIVWKKTNSPKSQSKALGEQHDIIFFYSKTKTFIFNKVYKNLDEKSLSLYSNKDENGKFQTVSIVAGGLQKYEGRKEFNFKGAIKPWLYSLEQLNKWWKLGLIYKTKNGNYRKKQYLRDILGKLISDLFVDNEVNPIQGSAKEYIGYPTQKPVALLERIIKASSNEGDVVLDPFCGCATTCIASEKLNRQWIGIDISHEAYKLVEKRLGKEVANPEDLTQHQIKVGFQASPPKRTDINDDDGQLKKYVYVISHKIYNSENKYKVGIASNTKTRLNSYQTGDPERAFKLEYEKLTPWFRETEHHVHSKFKYSHEWVKGKLEDIIREIENFDIDEYNETKGDLLLG